MRLRLRPASFLVCVLIGTLALSACGDPTATPVPATTALATTAAAATTAKPTTAVATTTAATTTAVTTTAAATTTAVATTAVATTAATTTSASSAGTLDVPAIAGLKELEIDPTFKSEFNKTIPPSIQNFVLKIYVSDDSDENVANSFDTTLTGAGYKFGLPGSSKMTKQGDAYGGLYMKDGAPDLLISVSLVPTDPTKLGSGATAGLSKDALQKLFDQLKGNKTVVFILGANDLLKMLFAATVTSTKTPVATSAAQQGGNGTELTGKLIATSDSDIRIKKVERFTELKAGNKTFTPKGVYLAVSLEIANLGKKPSGFSFLIMKDDKGNEIKTTEDYEASSILSSAYGYKSDFIINPGFVGSDYRLYDVPKDATGFTLEADNFGSAITRQPSNDSFSISGGKGADSGAGQELVGKTFADTSNKSEIKITKVERLTEIKNGSKTLKPDGNGVYLVVVYEAKNIGDKNLNSTDLSLKDSDGRIFSGITDFDVSFALIDKYPTLNEVAPGKTGNGFRVFQVVRDAAGFEPTSQY